MEEVGGNAEEFGGCRRNSEEGGKYNNTIQYNILIKMLNLIRYRIPGGFVIDWGDYECQSIKKILFPEKFAK